MTEDRQMIIERIWPQWKVEKEIGHGSYGVVYKCCRKTEDKKEYAAIKVISLNANTDSSFSDSLSGEQIRQYYQGVCDDIRNEANLLRSLKGNKNIVEIKESASLETEDGFYLLIRMDLLESFEHHISERAIKESDVKKLGIDLCSALIACHEKNIIHRDIKPKNILVDKEGNYELSDFGVAKKLEGRGYASSLKGNFEFMAPEVIHEQKSDARSDVYSLGLVLYWMLNGRTLPFVPKNGITKYSDYKKAHERRMAGEPLPKIQGVSEELNRVILKACQYKPGNRYRSAAEFQQALFEEVKFNWKKLLIITAIVFSVGLCAFLGYKIVDHITDDISQTKASAEMPGNEDVSAAVPSIEGIKIRLNDKLVDPIPVDITEHRLVGNWGFFLYMVEDEDSVDDSETPDWEKTNRLYPALFRYSTSDLIAERVNDRACQSYQIAQDCVYYIDSSIWGRDHGELYVLRPDGKNARLLAEEVSDFKIINDDYIVFSYSVRTTGVGYLASGLYRMNLDGSDKMICAFPVSAIIDGETVHFNGTWPYRVFEDQEGSFIDCGSFVMELAFPATGQEKIFVKDTEDNDWIYYITNSLMKIRKDGSDQEILDETHYSDEGDEYTWYDILRIEDEWIYYQKGDSEYRIKTDGSGFEPIKETDSFHTDDSVVASAVIEPRKDTAGNRESATYAPSSVVQMTSLTDSTQTGSIPSTASNTQATTVVNTTQRSTSVPGTTKKTTANPIITTKSQSTTKQTTTTTQPSTTTEATTNEKKTVSVTCRRVVTLTDKNAEIHVKTSFDAAKVELYATDASGNKYGPIDEVVKTDTYTWKCDCNFYVESTFTITAIAYDSNGEKTQGSTTFTYQRVF